MKTLSEMIKLVNEITEDSNMCDYPDDKLPMTLQEFDPIAAELVHYANREGYLQAENNSLKEKCRGFDILYSESENLKRQLNETTVNRQSWQSRAYAAEGKLYNIHEKARKARKATKK